ncbi:MAG: hypothetical protein IJW08_03840, partial [Lentisphaeria bacterium]|nr:hypothetical protein [Lentisphaeria bacterium]
APLSLSRKAGKLFYLLLPTHVGNRAFFYTQILHITPQLPQQWRLLSSVAHSKFECFLHTFACFYSICVLH